jgi:arylsulfatase A-like enzyme
VAVELHVRQQQPGAPGELAHLPPVEGDPAPGVEGEAQVRGVQELLGPGVLVHHRRQLDGSRAVLGQPGEGVVCRGRRGLLFAARSRTLLDEAAHQRVVERVAQPVLDLAGALLPAEGVAEPGLPVGHVGPGPDGGDAGREGVDVALGVVEGVDTLRQPALVQLTPGAELEVDLPQQRRVVVEEQLAEIRDGADLPEQLHLRGAPGQGADRLVLGQQGEGVGVVGLPLLDEPAGAGALAERGEERRGRGEVEGAVAPDQALHGGEAVGLEVVRHVRGELQGRHGAEGPVRLVAARAARDLAQLRRVQPPHVLAVELAERREGDVVHLEVEPHPDGVGGHQRVDLARLEHRHLGVAGPGRQRAEDHRGPAFLGLEPLRQLVHLVGGEGDDRRARREPGELLRPGEAQPGEALGLREARGREQLRHGAAHGVGPEEPGLPLAPGVEQPVGEDVASLRVRRQLDLVHREEIDLPIHWHRLDGADPVVGPPGYSPFLPGDQRDPGLPDPDRDLVVDLPRQQPQGQPDHPRVVGEQPLDGPVGLPRVGRPQRRGDRRALRHPAPELNRTGGSPPVTGQRFACKRDVDHHGRMISRRWLGALALAALAGCRRAPTIQPEPRKEAPVVPVVSVEASAVVSATVSAAPRPEPEKKPLRAENVLLLTVDTLRADQPWTGYTGAKTPRLSALVEQSVLYERAYAVANTTMPSLSAMMMARYPTELPRDDCGLPAFWGSETLGEVLKKGGLHGAGFHGHPIFAGAFAPSQGFDEWRLVKEALGRMATGGAVTGADIAELTVDFLRKNPKDRRFFAWAHFVDPHDSYVQHRDFPPGPSPQRGLYDGEVAYTDAQIGKVLSALDEAGLTERTLVLVAADHGESFGEHERFRHGHTLYEEEIRVPLILRIPGVSPRRIQEPRSLLDVARTVAELAGVPPSEQWRGTSLLRDLEGKPEPRPVLVDAPTLRTMMGQRAVIRGDDKVIFRGNTAIRFDLAGDPKEQRPEPLSPGSPAWSEVQRLFEPIQVVPPKTCYRGG